MRTEDQALRKCPTCLTPVKELDLGLKNYRWLRDALPGRVGLADLDGVLEQAATGRVLVFEFKPAGASIPLGQRLLLKRFVRFGCDVWVIWEGREDTHEVGAMDRAGNVPFVAKVSTQGLRQRVREWWQTGLNDLDRGQP